MTVKDNDMDECHNQNVEQKPETKEHILYESIYIIFTNRKKTNTCGYEVSHFTGGKRGISAIFYFFVLNRAYIGVFTTKICPMTFALFFNMFYLNRKIF